MDTTSDSKYAECRKDIYSIRLLRTRCRFRRPSTNFTSIKNKSIKVATRSPLQRFSTTIRPSSTALRVMGGQLESIPVVIGREGRVIPWTSHHRSSLGHKETNKQAHNYTHCCGELHSALFSSGAWLCNVGKTWAPAENPQTRRKNLQTPTQKRTREEETVPTAEPPSDD